MILFFVDQSGIRDGGFVMDRRDCVSDQLIKRADRDIQSGILSELLLKRDGIRDPETIERITIGQPLISRIGEDRMSGSHHNGFGAIVL